MNVVTIIDYGGPLGAAIAKGKAYAVAGAHLAVKLCASACLFTLMQVPRDHVCFYPDAWIGYHSPAWTGRSEPASQMIWERGRDWIAKGYQPC